MVADTSCNIAPLTPYTPTPEAPWSASRVLHLYRRIAFGASKSEVIAALSQDPSTVVDSLIDQAIADIPTVSPIWSNWNREEFQAAEDANQDQTTGFFKTEGKKIMMQDLIQNKVRDRMTLFWSNHFVTEDKVYPSPAYQSQYYSLLQLHALGNFRDFVYDIGISNAMLVYLNGDENKKNKPNENYARELFELFTLGVDNGYTEIDVQETAKALTGYVTTNKIPWGTILFDPDSFNTERKSIFDRTGSWGYDDVIDILFEERKEQIAIFICSKLYSYFVSPTPNDSIISQLAQTFRTQNFQLVPVLKQLFKSQHFFDQQAIGSIIKSPCDLLLCFYNELGFTFGIDDISDYLVSACSNLGQEVLDPVDVEGWQGDQDWISPDLLIGRWESCRFMIGQAWEQNKAQFRDFVIGLPIGTQSDGNLQATLQSDAVTQVVRTIVNYFFPRGIQDPVIFDEILGIFKAFYPPTYYDAAAVDPNIWRMSYPEVADQFKAVLDYIVDIPEFQLK